MRERVLEKVNSFKIGELLLREGFITNLQLKEAIDIQNKRKNYVPLGEICINQKFVSRAGLQKIIRRYQKSIPIGELMVNMGLITHKQLQIALEKQKVDNKKIGKILIERGFINEAALIDALSIQLGIPKISPSISLLDKKLLEKFNPEFLKKHQFLPAFKEGDILTVIMADPLDSETIRFLEKVLKCRIEPAIATPQEITKTILLFQQKLELGPEADTHEPSKDLVIGDKVPVPKSEDKIVEIVNFIISNAIKERASDIHIEPQQQNVRIRYRIDGIIHHKTDLPISLAPKLSNRIKVLCGLDIANKGKHQDGQMQAKFKNREFDLRTSTYASIWGENIVIRILQRRTSLIDIQMLGFSPVNLTKYLNMLRNPSGIILVTGPTGSGKTTTLYASIQHLNEMDRVIITIEDPVEQTIEGVIQGNIAPKIGMHYTDCLKAMMRQDPDVLMISEIRDSKSAEAVIQAALTGHKVLSTFHTDNTTDALLRLMDMGIETFSISSTLTSIVAQRLVRVLCTYCREPSKPAKGATAFFSTINDTDFDKYKLYRPKGCVNCDHTGFKGVTGIHEVLLVNDAIRDAILARNTSSEIRSVARKYAGLITMSEDGFDKAMKGITSLEEIIRVIYRDEENGLPSISVHELITLCKGKSNEHSN